MFEELVTECPDLVIVEYHSLDDYSNVYSEARITYYDVNVFPNSRFDGFFQPNWSSYPSYLQAYENRMDQGTNYTVNILLEGDGINFEGSVNVGWLNANNENKVLHIVLTESHIPESWYGGEELHYVTRLMIPDQFGTPIAGGKNPDALFDFSFSLDPDWVKDSCELVAFVQDTVTMEIYQANSIMMADVEITNYDIAIESIDFPGDEHCGEVLTPAIRIKNLCHESLNNCVITYEINGDVHEFDWTGSLETDSSAWVSLPEVAIELQAENSISVELSLPNGEEDQDPENDMLEKDFLKAEVINSPQLILELLTDDNGQQTHWELINGAGEIMDEGSGYEDNTLYTINWELLDNACYSFTLLDSGGDGICCENGNGYYKIKDSEGNIYFEGGEFGYEIQALFQLDVATEIVDQRHEQGIQVFPNPAKDQISINSSSDILSTVVYNRLGQQVYHNADVYNTSTIDIREFNPGLYFFQVKTRGGVLTEKVIVK